MKKTLSLISLLLIGVLLLTGCFGSDRTALGVDTKLSIVVPDEYKSVIDTSNKGVLITYFYRDDDRLSFNVYDRDADEGVTLESEAKAEAEKYGTTPTPININGIDAMTFRYVDEELVNTPTVICYAFLERDEFLVVSFETDNSAEMIAEAEAIINTLKK